MNRNLHLSVLFIGFVLVIGLGVAIFDKNLVQNTEDQLAAVIGPSINNVAISNITSAGATLTWTTDKISSSSVDTKKYGDSTWITSPYDTSNTTNSTTHKVLVNGLMPNTKYYYRVVSCASTTNCNTKTSKSTFTTLTNTINTTPVTSTCPNATDNPADTRDVWAWHSNAQLVTPNSTYQNQFFTFADSHKVKNIYLNVSPSFLTGSSASNIKDFLNKAKAHCMNVEALGGAENWVALPGNSYFTQGTPTAAAIEFATAVKNFNSSIISPNATFSAIQLDTEPHTLRSGDGYYPYWNLVDTKYTKEQSNMAIANALIDMLRAVRGVVGTSMKINFAPPRWYDTNTSLQSFNRTGAGVTGKNAMQYMFDQVDMITIQDYVTTADSIYKDAKNELDYAVATGKKVRIGLLLDQDTSAPTSTYYGSTCTKLNTDIASSYTLMAAEQKTVFDGYAIEQYDTSAGYPSSWSAMCP